mgnify:CR=1 FL=1
MKTVELVRKSGHLLGEVLAQGRQVVLAHAQHGSRIPTRLERHCQSETYVGSSGAVLGGAIRVEVESDVALVQQQAGFEQVCERKEGGLAQSHACNFGCSQDSRNDDSSLERHRACKACNSCAILPLRSASGPSSAGNSNISSISSSDLASKPSSMSANVSTS